LDDVAHLNFRVVALDLGDEAWLLDVPASAIKRERKIRRERRENSLLFANEKRPEVHRAFAMEFVEETFAQIGVVHRDVGEQLLLLSSAEDRFALVGENHRVGRIRVVHIPRRIIRINVEWRGNENHLERLAGFAQLRAGKRQEIRDHSPRTQLYPLAESLPYCLSLIQVQDFSPCLLRTVP
jgi:hypothetical protein